MPFGKIPICGAFIAARTFTKAPFHSRLILLPPSEQAHSPPPFHQPFRLLSFSRSRPVDRSARRILPSRRRIPDDTLPYWSDRGPLSPTPCRFSANQSAPPELLTRLRIQQSIRELKKENAEKSSVTAFRSIQRNTHDQHHDDTVIGFIDLTSHRLHKVSYPVPYCRCLHKVHLQSAAQALGYVRALSPASNKKKLIPWRNGAEKTHGLNPSNCFKASISSTLTDPAQPAYLHLFK